MNDLISRQAVIELIEFGVETLKIALDRIDVTYNDREKFSWGISLLESYIEDIKELSHAQPERKKGKWIRHDEIRNVYGGICIECSECGEKYVVQHIEDEKYCRNCGADMRGEHDE